MSILVTGATGAVGSLVVQGLVAAGAEVRALVRSPGKMALPAGVKEVVGDLREVTSLRTALQGVRTLFVLNAVAPDELTQALNVLNLAHQAGIERIVYLSVIHADRFTDVPHFTGKHTVERMIEGSGPPATILRPAYFMQNDVPLLPVVSSYGVYPMPIGPSGVEMIDVRDIADIAVAELLARDRADKPLPTRTLDLVGPQSFTGAQAAAVWSEVLQRPIQAGGDDLDAFEQQLAAQAPDWMAFDLRLMMAQIQRHGMHGRPGAVQVLERLLGRPLRTYQDFVKELAGA
ncbi:SDR family oxidoreductase [Herbaspirillum seropedicae]|uniref:SDR family oxidoreductase n=1 Tax=Herbaspirillum seropedicae TaxID=964 RepID=UPI000847D9E0|nr:NmrA family NAD(P)-binding protein [Herbaspirillum seropedicae]AON52746.1 nucleoside-diphosphate-sugar epimerase [Herbaspirillum seropedicae]